MTVVLRVAVPDGHERLRVADPAWDEPIDASYSVAIGGRWNSPRTWAEAHTETGADVAAHGESGRGRMSEHC